MVTFYFSADKKLEKYLDDTCKILLIEAHNKSKPFKEILK